MKIIIAVLFVAAFVAGAAAAQGVSCAVDTTNKRLSGAAASSYMKKCAAAATTKCEADAATKKLAGAAKAAFNKKCVKDAVGK